LYSNAFIRDYSWNGNERNRLLVNRGDGHFVEAATAYGVDSLGDGRGLAISDFDGDGDLDLIVSNYNRPANYFVNHTAKGNWLKVRLRGRKNNRDGIGAILRIQTGDRRQMRVVTAGDGFASQYSRIVHFGLDAARQVDQLDVIWPNGHRQKFHGIAANQFLEIDEQQHQPGAVKRIASR
jgi:hypothetical protein